MTTSDNGNLAVRRTREASTSESSVHIERYLCSIVSARCEVHRDIISPRYSIQSTSQHWIPKPKRRGNTLRDNDFSMDYRFLNLYDLVAGLMNVRELDRITDRNGSVFMDNFVRHRRRRDAGDMSQASVGH